MKHQIAILLLVITFLAGYAANDDIIVDGVTYEWYENSVAHQYGYVATGWDEVTPIQSLHIRGEVDGYQVFGITNGAFEDNEDIVYLTIDEGITFIGENAFCRCSNIEVAILPEGLETIEEEAFAFCTGLTMMVIPSTVTEIQAHAFSDCTGVTDVYFLMTDQGQLDDFNWWDGVYEPGEEAHGGMEFNKSRKPYDGDDPHIEHDPVNGTIVHIPEGTYDIYDESGKLEAWLFEEDDNCYPLWWIVNYGMVGREYTVSDALTAVYVDINGGLYAKDDNLWLAPDRTYSDEVDYMRSVGLMTHSYDQSNWVVLTNVDDPKGYINSLIAGKTITGTLIDKKNPVIEVSDDAELEKSGQSLYQKNVYIPASFMGRTQTGADSRTYVFVQPKPQELITIDWTIYSEAEECFYLPSPDEDKGINTMELTGGIRPSYDLYEAPSVPELVDCAVYSFNAVNRLTVEDADDLSEAKPRRASQFTPYVEGGMSTRFTVYPLSLSDDPILTGIGSIVADHLSSDSRVWHTIDGRCLITVRPTAPGFYIHSGKKVVIK